MSSRENLAVEKLLIKLRVYLQSISRGNSGNVVRNVTVDGRVYNVRVTRSGMVEVTITLGSTKLYAYYNGRDSLVYSGSDQTSGASGKTGSYRRIDDNQVAYLLRTNIKRAFPDYTRINLKYTKPTTKKGRHRMVSGEMVPY
jgi:hypothetical protein